ncbi:zinc finger protein, putative [Trypanosoma brucei gambiense DAL972]|uniref:Zinc finger protein, putative n=1 Tax=Trypanosoma brucei gambiense (strain MHOM/CI/86/DAL972) TaxID=679716 RepID=C9ZR30_TRYB9|nr:zinc finger protein, putative [Trypanosoma brucei gambiense DAL972]CBH11860.1 zinc finger protein, putative [Trypanosoma brucei gambiense DAL972]|eukprot:XP_011774145.1 zinc finger protein, putative [Trypanosoma brucei gambiense DAL972]
MRGVRVRVGFRLAAMGFEFKLHQPPCDIAFLSVVDGPALYSSEEGTQTSMKESMIRQIGWQELDLPLEWFFSKRAYHLVRRVSRTMQCTIQYLSYRQQMLETEAKRAEEKLRDMREESDRVFAELAELREIVSMSGVKRQDPSPTNRKVAHERWRGHSRITEQLHTCLYCGNNYPSNSSLNSHMIKRHRRVQHYPLTEETTASPPESSAAIEASNDPLMAEVSQIKHDLAFLREFVTNEQRCNKQNKNDNAMLASTGNAALPVASQPCSPPPDDINTSLQRKQVEQEMIIKKFQEELHATQLRVAQLEASIRQRNVGSCNFHRHCDVVNTSTAEPKVLNCVSFASPAEVYSLPSVKVLWNNASGSTTPDPYHSSLRQRSCDTGNLKVEQLTLSGNDDASSAFDTSVMLLGNKDTSALYQQGDSLDNSLEPTQGPNLRPLHFSGAVGISERVDVNGRPGHQAIVFNDETFMGFGSRSCHSAAFSHDSAILPPSASHTQFDVCGAVQSRDYSRTFPNDQPTTAPSGSGCTLVSVAPGETSIKSSVGVNSYFESERPKESSTTTKATSVSSTHVSKTDSGGSGGNFSGSSVLSMRGYGAPGIHGNYL